MKTLILKEPGEWEIKEISLDGNLQEDEVILKVHRIGIRLIP